jgi:hypothetical protein
MDGLGDRYAHLRERSAGIRPAHVTSRQIDFGRLSAIVYFSAWRKSKKAVPRPIQPQLEQPAFIANRHLISGFFCFQNRFTFPSNSAQSWENPVHGCLDCAWHFPVPMPRWDAAVHFASGESRRQARHGDLHPRFCSHDHLALHSRTRSEAKNKKASRTFQFGTPGSPPPELPNHDWILGLPRSGVNVTYVTRGQF